MPCPPPRTEELDCDCIGIGGSCCPYEFARRVSRVEGVGNSTHEGVSCSLSALVCCKFVFSEPPPAETTATIIIMMMIIVSMTIVIV